MMARDRRHSAAGLWTSLLPRCTRPTNGGINGVHISEVKRLKAGCHQGPYSQRVLRGKTGSNTEANADAGHMGGSLTSFGLNQQYQATGSVFHLEWLNVNGVSMAWEVGDQQMVARVRQD